MALRAIVFDFDGVLVESNDIKLNAYGTLCAPYGGHVCSRVRAFCETRMGVSRFRLIEAVHRDLLQHPLPPATLAELCRRFGEIVVDQVVAAPSVPGAIEFLSRHAGQYRFFIVSGTPEEELRRILKRRDMDGWFEAAFGPPAPKEALLEGILAAGFHANEIVHVGDSDLDWAAVRPLGIPFIWRRVAPGRTPPEGFLGPVIDSLDQLVVCLSPARLGDSPCASSTSR